MNRPTKKIILVKNLNEENMHKLEDELSSSLLEYEISLVTRSVSIIGDNDDLYNAKVILRENGFLIE